MDDKSSPKGRGQVTWTIEILDGTNDISGTAEARVVRFCTPVNCVKSEHMDDIPPLEGAWWSRVCDPF